MRIIKVLEVGSSAGVAFPALIRKELGIKRGDNMALAVYQNDTIVLRKISPEELIQLRPPTILYD